jgi:hypothetical protein
MIVRVEVMVSRWEIDQLHRLAARCCEIAAAAANQRQRNRLLQQAERYEAEAKRLEAELALPVGAE